MLRSTSSLPSKDYRKGGSRAPSPNGCVNEPLSVVLSMRTGMVGNDELMPSLFLPVDVGTVTAITGGHLKGDRDHAWASPSGRQE